MKRFLTLSALVSLVAIAPTALADRAQPGPAPKVPRPAAEAAQPDEASTGEKTDRGILAGPRVEKGALGPGESARRSGIGPQRLGSNGGPRSFFRLVEGLELDPAQREQVRAIATEFEAAVEGFRTQHAEELRSLRSRAEEARRAGGKVPRAIRKSLRALERIAPQAGPYRDRILATLDDAQRATLVERATALREMARTRRGPGRAGARGPDDGEKRPSRREGDGAKRAAPMGGTNVEPANDGGEPEIVPAPETPDMSDE